MPEPDPTDAGLRWETVDGLPRCVTSPDGTPLVRTELASTTRLVLRLPDHREVALALDTADHPILGRCDAIEGPDGEVLALGSRTDWRHPTTIPALDRPGALPTGAGTAILNLLAWQAVRAGVGSLRYGGPYPSPALWGSLMTSFHVREPQAHALSRFVADAQARALAGTHTEIDVDFCPAPHVWEWPSPRICVQRRQGRVERVYIDGRAFDDSPVAPRRLITRPRALVAVVGLGPEIWCERLVLSLAGEPQSEPHPLPTPPATLVGTTLPDPVVSVLGEILVAQAPDLLQPALRVVLGSATLRWGDPGADLTRWNDGVLELHAGMVAALPTDPTTLLGVLVQLVEPPLRRAAAATLHAAWSRRSHE